MLLRSLREGQREHSVTSGMLDPGLGACNVSVMSGGIIV